MNEVIQGFLVESTQEGTTYLTNMEIMQKKCLRDYETM